MSLKCAFSSIILHRAWSTRLLSTELSRAALILSTHHTGVRYAGHSHWQNIKKTKESKDLAKSRAYNDFIRSFGKEISKGSPDPKQNTRLAELIKQAQSINMPSSTINNALKRFERLKKNPPKQTLYYRGSNNLTFMLIISSDSLIKVRSDLNILFKKQGFIKADPNSTKSAFIVKGCVIAKPPEDITDVSGKTMEDAIEAGAEEVEPSEDVPEHFQFICEEPELNIVKSKLEGKKYVIESAEPLYIPRNPVELEDNELEKLFEFLQRIEDQESVVKVVVNIV